MHMHRLHHISIICSDYQASKSFYTGTLGLKIIRETYRKERDSFKLYLALNDEYLIELFSFPGSPPRTTGPEATGLRHIAFEVEDLMAILLELDQKKIRHEEWSMDELTGKRFTFLFDPDGLPIELYERTANF